MVTPHLTLLYPGFFIVPPRSNQWKPWLRGDVVTSSQSAKI